MLTILWYAVFGTFLSIQAQDFIEEFDIPRDTATVLKFLSIQAQDFIEE